MKNVNFSNFWIKIPLILYTHTIFFFEFIVILLQAHK